MTSTPFPPDVPGADDHPDVAEISALTEGLLSPEPAAELRTHLSGCELCADVRASLEEIREALGTLPGPVRMPADIEGRIEAALAAEALLDSAPPHSSSVSRETVPRGHRMPRHAAAAVSRETTAARSGDPGAPNRPAGRPGGATGPVRHRPSRRARRWRTALLAGAASIAVLGIGGLVMDSLNSPSPDAAASRTTRGGQGGADRADPLEQRVQSLLAQGEGTSKSKGAGAPEVTTEQSPGNKALAGEGVIVPSCVRKGIGRTDAALAVDENARYKGGTGFLVVLPHRGDPQRVDAYVVDRSCVSGASGGPGEVLTTRIYPRR